MFIVWIVCTLLIFTVVVLAHEWGHFSVARFFWVKVEEFGLWIPPKAKKLFTDKKGTLYSLNWIPLGGFVRLKWEAEAYLKVYSERKKQLSFSEIKKYLRERKDIFDSAGKRLTKSEMLALDDIIAKSEDSDNFHKKAYWKQSLVILAGVIMNFLLAWFLFSLLFLIGIKPVGILSLTEIHSDSLLVPSYEQAIEKWVLLKKSGIFVTPISHSNAEKYGLLAWDLVLWIDGISLSSPEQFKNILLSKKWQKVSLEVSRSWSVSPLDIMINEEGKIGAYIGENIDYNREFQYKMSFSHAFYFWWKEVYEQSSLALQWLRFILSKILFPQKAGERSEAIQSMSWPIGLTEVVTEGLSQWFLYLVTLAALISVNLGIFNLLPIPALDGGRFLFICLHAFFWIFSKDKFISTYFENLIHVFFFMLLIAISIWIAYNDIIKIFHS